MSEILFCYHKNPEHKSVLTGSPGNPGDPGDPGFPCKKRILQIQIIRKLNKFFLYIKSKRIYIYIYERNIHGIVH